LPTLYIFGKIFKLSNNCSKIVILAFVDSLTELSNNQSIKSIPSFVPNHFCRVFLLASYYIRAGEYRIARETCAARGEMRKTVSGYAGIPPRN